VTSNLLFFEIVASHTILKHLEQVVDDVNDEDSDEVEEIASRVTNFKEIVKKMRMKYDKCYGTPKNINPLVYIAPIFDPRYKLVGLELSLCDFFGEVQGSIIALKVKEKVEVLFDEYWQLYKPLTPQSGQSSRVQPEVERSSASGGADSYAQELRKKLKGPDGGRGIIKIELQKYLNKGLEEDEVGDDMFRW